MRMADVVATLILVVIAFTTMILAISFEMARVQLWDSLNNAAIDAGFYGKMNAFLIQMEVVFWMIFLISLFGLIVVYFIGSHEEEGETYAPPQEYINP